jgi:hypothetical protein
MYANDSLDNLIFTDQQSVLRNVLNPTSLLHVLDFGTKYKVQLVPLMFQFSVPHKFIMWVGPFMGILACLGEVGLGQRGRQIMGNESLTSSTFLIVFRWMPCKICLIQKSFESLKLIFFNMFLVY